MAAAEQRYPARRPSVLKAVGLILLTWACAVVGVLAVAADTEIGPVVFKITKNHGIHLGDLYALVAAIAAATLISLLVIVSHVRSRSRYKRALRAAPPRG